MSLLSFLFSLMHPGWIRPNVCPVVYNVKVLWLCLQNKVFLMFLCALHCPRHLKCIIEDVTFFLSSFSCMNNKMIHCFLYLLLDYLFLFFISIWLWCRFGPWPMCAKQRKNFFLYSIELMLRSDSLPKQTVDFLFSASSYCPWRLRGNDIFNFPILGTK